MGCGKPQRVEFFRGEAGSDVMGWNVALAGEGLYLSVTIGRMQISPCFENRAPACNMCLNKCLR